MYFYVHGIWAASWRNQQNGMCAQRRLIRVFAVRMKKALVLSYPLSAQQRLWSDWAEPRLIWVFAGRTVILLVLSWSGSFLKQLSVCCSFVTPKSVLWRIECLPQNIKTPLPLNSFVPVFKSLYSCIIDGNFRVTWQCQEISSFTRGYKTTLMHDVRTSYWRFDVNISFDVIFCQHFDANVANRSKPSICWLQM